MFCSLTSASSSVSTTLIGSYFGSLSNLDQIKVKALRLEIRGEGGWLSGTAFQPP